MNLHLPLSLKWTNAVVVIFVQYQGNWRVSVGTFTRLDAQIVA
jgi:hypothetical protein